MSEHLRRRRGALLAATPERRYPRSRRVATPVRTALGLAALLAISPHNAYPQDMPVSVETQLSLILRILTFDRQLHARVGDDILVAIVYQPRVRPSATARDAMKGLLDDGVTVAGLSVRSLEVEAADTTDLRTILAGKGVDLLYVTPMRAYDIEPLAALTRQLGILTCTGVPEYVERGLALGIGARSGRPRLFINLGAARAEGAQFSPELLRIAKIVDGN